MQKRAVDLHDFLVSHEGKPLLKDERFAQDRSRPGSKPHRMNDGVFRCEKTWELVILRHGRTAWNDLGRFQGHTDIPLDATGRAQAGDLRAHLAHERFSRAISSDLGRAYETAAIVLGVDGPTVEKDPRWREMRFGKWEGLTWTEIVSRYPAMADRPSKTPKFYTPAGGESFEEVCTRVRAALHDIDTRAKDGDVIVVATHAGALHAVLRVALGESEADALRVRFEPATATRFAFSPAGVRLLDLNRSPAASAT